MKRLITPILIIITIVAVIVGVSWLVSRKKATNQGTAPLTFREFVSTDSGTTTPDGTGSTLDGQFTGNNGTSGTNGDGSNTNGGQTDPGTRTSSFVGPTVRPTSSGSNSNNSGGSGTTGTNGSGPASTPDSTTDPTRTPTRNPTPIIRPDPRRTITPTCSNEDLNITFTPDELARLTALQNRVYAISSTLHDDADVATEKANMDSFVIKEIQLASLQKTICTEAQNLSDPAMKRRVPTPFWVDITDPNLKQGFVTDGFTRISSSPIPGFPGAMRLGNERIPPTQNFDYGKKRLEQIFRINLW